MHEAQDRGELELSVCIKMKKFKLPSMFVIHTFPPLLIHNNANKKCINMQIYNHMHTHSFT
jgi:hypothetical protein